LNKAPISPNPPEDFRFPLHSIYFYPTESCNLKCVHCWIHPSHAPDDESYGRQNRNNVSVETMDRVVREALPLGLSSVKITGGEPFLAPSLFEYLDVFDRHGLTMSFETNGTLLNEGNVARLSHYNVRTMSVSLDGSRSETHDRIRGVAGSFDEAVRGIRLLVDAGLRPQVIFCLQESNGEDVVPTMQLAYELGVKFFEINPLTSLGGADRRCRGLRLEDLLDLEKRIEGKLAQRFEGMRLDLYLPPALKSMRELVRHRPCSCKILNICAILSNGDVSICGIGRDQRGLILGNVKLESITRLWREGAVFGRIRNSVPHRLRGVCSRCIFRYTCLGFCRAEVMGKGGEVGDPYSLCQQAYESGLFPQSRLVDAEPGTKTVGVAQR
jgi:SynChlorMet cassette radical SAM/SPASM protein ScmF